MEMTNKEKHQWLMCEILQAVLASKDSPDDFVEFNCPWGARYKVVNDPGQLNSFGKLVTNCPGFGGPKPRNKNPSVSISRMKLEHFNKKYRDDMEVDYDLNA